MIDRRSRKATSSVASEFREAAKAVQSIDRLLNNRIHWVVEEIRSFRKEHHIMPEQDVVFGFVDYDSPVHVEFTYSSVTEEYVVVTFSEYDYQERHEELLFSDIDNLEDAFKRMLAGVNKSSEEV